MNIIEITQQLEFSYSKNKQYIYCIPTEVTITPAKIYSIQGVSGSGKSTILTLLAALRRFNKGSIKYHLHGQQQPIEITSKKWKIGPNFWGKIGFSFQKPELIQALTVKANLEIVLGEKNTEQMALHLFETQEWNEIKNSRIWTLSGGQTQRLGLIRAFEGNQNLVFLDEPTNNLDKSNRTKIVDFIKKYRQNKAIICVSHDKDFLDMLNIDTTFEICENQQTNGKKQRILQLINHET